jgi:ABC-type branched-subunit amino acid transport system ATPase component
VPLIGGRGVEFEQRRQQVLSLFPAEERLTQVAGSCRVASSKCSLSDGINAQPSLLLLDEPSLDLPRK